MKNKLSDKFNFRYIQKEIKRFAVQHSKFVREQYLRFGLTPMFGQNFAFIYPCFLFFFWSNRGINKQNQNVVNYWDNIMENIYETSTAAESN